TEIRDFIVFIADAVHFNIRIVQRIFSIYLQVNSVNGILSYFPSRSSEIQLKHIFIRIDISTYKRVIPERNLWKKHLYNFVVNRKIKPQKLLFFDFVRRIIGI